MRRLVTDVFLWLKSSENKRWEKSDHSAVMHYGIKLLSRMRNGIVGAVDSGIVRGDFTGS